ncbi:helix-turn-helix transcriptional regulator [Paenibacillus sp. FSL K6-1230]|uniref:helix-turn-helix transcriptional regulator n=1 Tax=Paenibacillus sp. FSL K6-1230 TaxID=2921603 RepID=UPI0030F9FDB3
MRADRLLALLLLLQTHGKLTTRELAERLEVSSRTVIRDLEALSVAGLPVYSERGPDGGWRLMEDFRSRLGMMRLHEIKSLFIVPSDTIMRQLGLPAREDEVRAKLLHALPSPMKREAEQFLDKIYIDTGTWAPAVESKEQAERFALVYEAVWQELQLQMEYEKADGSRIQRSVAPLGLVAKGNTWYLVASSGTDQLRSYRLSRMLSVQITSDAIVRPAEFSLRAYWHQSKNEFVQGIPVYEADVLAHRSILGRLTFTGKFVKHIHLHEERSGERLTDENFWTRVSLHFNDEEEIVEYVMGFGERMKLLQPEHLIDTIAERAQAILKLYGSSKIISQEQQATQST